MQKVSQTVEAKIEQMTSLDHTIPKIIQLCNDNSSSTRDLIKVIQMDPVLTGKVLKLVNGSFFGLPNRITALSRAVILLGVNTIKHLALTTCVLTTFQGKSRSKILNSEDFWTYSVGAAVYCQLLGKHLRLERQLVDELFLIGLLHNIGKAFLLQFYPVEYEQALMLSKERESPLQEVESELFGITHLEIGSRLAHRWGMQDWLTDAVENYLKPMDSAMITTKVLSIAVIMLHEYDVGNSGNPCPPSIQPEVWDTLKLSYTDAESILVNRLKGELEKASEFVKGV